MQALEKVLAFLEKLILKLRKNKKSNLSLKSLEEEKYLEGIKNGKYDHHTFKGRMLNITLKKTTIKCINCFVI